MKKWEYKRLSVDVGELSTLTIDQKLSELGAEGWELASVVLQERHGYSHEVHFFLKREWVG